MMHSLLLWGVFVLTVLQIALMVFVHRVAKDARRALAQINELTIRLSRYDILDRRKQTTV